MRRFLCLFLLVLMPLQAFAQQGGWTVAETKTGASGVTVKVSQEIAHEIAHVNGESHHHDDNGALHFDKSTESSQHLAEHGAGNAPVAGLPSTHMPPVSFRRLTLAISPFEFIVPEGLPECPQRPPCAFG